MGGEVALRKGLFESFRSIGKQLAFDMGLDLTRLGQRLLGLPLTPRDVTYLTADLKKPTVSGYAEVDPSAVITGIVKIRDYAKIGKNSVLRADTSRLFIQNGAKLEETIILSTSRKIIDPLNTQCKIYKATIGNRCVLSSCIVHTGATLGDECVVGEGSIIGYGAQLEKGTVIPPGKIVPGKTRWGGNPAQYLGPAVDDHH